MFRRSLPFAREVIRSAVVVRPAGCRSITTNEAISELRQKLQDQNRSRTRAELSSETVKMGDPAHGRPDLARLRVVPKDSAFYMYNPGHQEIMRRLRELEQKYINVPTVPAAEYTPPRWLTLDGYRARSDGNRVRPADYRQFVKLATRLHSIEPQLMPSEVELLLQELKREGSVAESTRRVIPPLDSQGRAVAVGHRKTSSARVVVAEAKEGTVGQIRVNGVSLDQAFPQLMHRLRVTYPLRVIESATQYNVFATVQGGGITGQVDAVAHGLGQALRIQNPLLGPRLKKAGCLTRDIRIKERKKPGLAKARKAYTWVKR